MIRLVCVATLLMAFAVAAFAYDPPSEDQVLAMQLYTTEDTVQMWVSVDEDCDVEESRAEGLVEAMMIRSRVRRESGQAVLALAVTCLRPSFDEYVYIVDPSLYVMVLGGILPLEIPNFHAIVGITQSPDDIEDAVVDVAERMITDLIYAHGQVADSDG